jgi:hypothetical protein
MGLDIHLSCLSQQMMDTGAGRTLLVPRFRLLPILQQISGEVRHADCKRRHQRAGVAMLTANLTNSHRCRANGARAGLDIASAGNPNNVSPKTELIWAT